MDGGYTCNIYPILVSLPGQLKMGWGGRLEGGGSRYSSLIAYIFILSLTGRGGIEIS